jgi:rhodanese-related sulfurtransferase
MGSEKAEKLEIDEARQQIASGDARAVDVRDEEGWKEGHVTNAIHMPEADSSPELEELDEGSRLIVFAENDRAAGEAAEGLREKGFEVAIASGGMDAWNKEGFQIQPTDDPDEETELGRSD